MNRLPTPPWDVEQPEEPEPEELSHPNKAVQADADDMCRCGKPDCEDCGDGLPIIILGGKNEV